MKRGGPLRRRKPASPRPPARTGPSGGKATPRPVAPKKPRARPLEPGEAEWKKKRWGRCDVCGTSGRIVWHHCVAKRKIRDETTKDQQSAGVVWDQRNALAVGAPLLWGGRCHCHDQRIPFSKVPPSALEFAVEVLGAGPAENYWTRHYDGAGEWIFRERGGA